MTTTVGVGTEGYMPSEQAAGMPKLNSDLYAIGILVIEALTGIPAYALKRDTHGSILWRNQVPYLDEGFATILQKLVEYDFRKRYQSATEVQVDLAPHCRSAGRHRTSLWPGDRLPQAQNQSDPSILRAATDETNMLPVNWFAEPTQDQDG